MHSCKSIWINIPWLSSSIIAAWKISSSVAETSAVQWKKGCNLQPACVLISRAHLVHRLSDGQVSFFGRSCKIPSRLVARLLRSLWAAAPWCGSGGVFTPTVAGGVVVIPFNTPSLHSYLESCWQGCGKLANTKPGRYRTLVWFRFSNKGLKGATRWILLFWRSRRKL